jgi:pilus assembly protein Flp/PilA
MRTLNLRSIIRRFAKDESGSNALEYGLIVGLISLAIVAGAGAAGTALNTLFADIGTQITTQASKVAGTAPRS